MARITREEGLYIAERAAWAERGSKNSFWFTHGQRLVPVAGIVVAAGAFLWGVHWTWERVTQASLPEPTGVPTLAWVALVALIIGTAIAIRSFSRARSMGTVLVLGAAIVAGWLGAGAYAIGVMV